MNDYKQSLELFRIPEYMHEGIIAYVETGRQPGDFLTAVINNDLMRAVVCADENNIHLLKNYVQWFRNEPPGACHGYHGVIKDWQKVLKKQEVSA